MKICDKQIDITSNTCSERTSALFFVENREISDGYARI